MRTRQIPLLACLVAASSLPAAAAVVVGYVFDSQTGKGILRARVTVAPVLPLPELGSAGISNLIVLTDQDGRFECRNLPDGRLSVVAEKTSYLVDSDKRMKSDAQALVTISRYDVPITVNLKLTPQAIVKGRTVDEDGHPVAVNLKLLGPGLDKYARSTRVVTVDRTGEFRFAGLKPGRYYLWNEGRRDSSGRKTFPPRYYANAISLKSAKPIDVQPGEEKEIEFGVRSAQAYEIRGGLDCPDFSVSLHLFGQPDLSVSPYFVSNGQPGTFTLLGVPSGVYELSMNCVENGTPHNYLKVITVNDADVYGVVLEPVKVR